MRKAPEDEQLGLLFKPSGSCINQNLFANDSSNSSCLMISSGIAEYIVEENDGGKEAIYLRYEPNGINLRWIQNNEVPTNSFVHECHPIMVWMRQSSSSINNHNPIQLYDLLTEDGLPSNGMSNGMDQSTFSVNAQTPVQSHDLLAELPSFPVAGAGIVRSLIVEYIVEENDGGEGFSLDGKHLYYKRKALEDEQLGARLVLALEAAPIMHQPSSVTVSGLGASAGPSDIHQAIGVAGEAQHGQRNIRMRKLPKDEWLGLLFKLSRSCIDQNPFANNPSNYSSLVISSGIVEYIVEENDGGEGYPINGRPLYCERRAPKDEQLGVGLVLALEAAPVMH
ncbi:hypothetical protein GH714_014898 [Hevea brasiliensis]|uniref:Uncharacterized protein n=1 Tax=Hevea brasiliensis TaxID=3981 RepID=A0A6A6KPQ9_HEVBR|nr:hypothetical protein GH714_014898 [Hevea brasiliensis]